MSRVGRARSVCAGGLDGPPAAWLSGSLVTLLERVLREVAAAPGESPDACFSLGGVRPEGTRPGQAEDELALVHVLELARSLRLAAERAQGSPEERGTGQWERALLAEALGLCAADGLALPAALTELVRAVVDDPTRSWPRASVLAAAALALAPSSHGHSTLAQCLELEGDTHAAAAAYARSVGRAASAGAAVRGLQGLARVQRAMGRTATSRALERERAAVEAMA